MTTIIHHNLHNGQIVALPHPHTIKDLCDVIYAVFSDAESAAQLKELEDERKTPLKEELDGVMQL